MCVCLCVCVCVCVCVCARARQSTTLVLRFCRLCVHGCMHTHACVYMHLCTLHCACEFYRLMHFSNVEPLLFYWSNVEPLLFYWSNVEPLLVLDTSFILYSHTHTHRHTYTAYHIKELPRLSTPEEQTARKLLHSYIETHTHRADVDDTPRYIKFHALTYTSIRAFIFTTVLPSEN
jgi:hypothetical protein